MTLTASCWVSDESQKVDSSFKAYCFGKMIPTEESLKARQAGEAGPAIS